MTSKPTMTQLLFRLGQLPSCGCGLPLKPQPQHTLVSRVELLDAGYSPVSIPEDTRNDFKEALEASRVPVPKSVRELALSSAVISITLYCRQCRWLVDVRQSLDPKREPLRRQWEDWQAIVQPIDGL